MASNSPETESKKRKQSTGHLKRDQPLFTTRRSGLSQQPPESFNGDRNASNIPSPSPTKESTHLPKPRQRLGTSRPLAATFISTPSIKDENQRPTSDRKLTTYGSHRPTKSNVPSLAKSSRSSQIPRAKTPSPVRGRQFQTTSPFSSESSPPRGLAEAYKRIDDEESLAQEDSIDDDMAAYAYDPDERSQELDRARMQRVQATLSPISLNASRRASPRPLAELQADEVKTKDMESYESDHESVLSNLDNLTETSVGSSQHARDLQRVSDAMKSNTQAFSKARIGERVGLTMENLKRRNASSESLGSVRSGSISSKESNHSVNVPAKWGRKARPGRDWLNRMSNKSGLTGDTPKKGAETSENPEGERLDEWVTAVPVVQEKSLQPSTSRDRTPTSTNRKKSLERVAEWEINDDDFTGRSLQVSDSPPIRVRNGTLGRILEREIDSLAKRAVTTNRLGELREKTSEELLGRKLHSQSAEDLTRPGLGEDSATLRRRRSSLKFPLKPFVDDKSYSSISGAVLGSGGDHIPDSPITIYRSTSDVSSDNGAKTDDEKGSSRPKHERGDSRDLLRKLARVTSQSPTPTREDTRQDVMSKIQPDQTPSKARSMTEVPERAVNTESHLPERPNIPKPTQITPRQSKSTADLKTPVVSGAWIETPHPSHGHPRPTSADIDKKFNEDNVDPTRKVATTDLIRNLNPNTLPRPKVISERSLKDTGPTLPKSALESIISAAKSNSKATNPDNLSSNVNYDSEEDPTLQLGESTIQSLEEILEDDADFSTLLAPSPSISPEGETSIEKPLTPAQKSRLSELESYTRQISRLENVGPSIRDARRRLAVLEKAVSKSASATAQVGECDEAGEFHDFIWPCERCGCPARRDLEHTRSVSSHLATVPIPVPKLWRWRRDDWRPRLTWLGVAVVVFWVWLIGDWIAW